MDKISLTQYVLQIYLLAVNIKIFTIFLVQKYTYDLFSLSSVPNLLSFG